MPSLKALRTRINSVKSTQKITSAMKMVASAKLRRAQSQAEAARPYAERMARMLASLADSVRNSPGAPPLLVGTGKDQTHLLVMVTADRGLAGGFNASVGRLARATARRLQAEGKTVKVLAVGRKGRDFARREFSGQLVGDINYVGRKSIAFTDAQEIASRLLGHDAGRRVRCRSSGVQSVPLDRLPGSNRDPADPRAAAEGRGSAGPSRASRRRSTNSSRTRRRFSCACCRRIWRFRSIRRCWRIPPASTARRCRRWTMRPATPAR